MNQETRTGNQQDIQRYRYQSAFYIGIALVSIFLCVVIWRYSFEIPDRPAKYLFIAQSCLSVLIFAVIAVQAAIYVEQWRVMANTLVETSRSAEAAQAQITLQANAQRPWLFMIPDKDFRPIRNLGKLDWIIRNRGQTTARLLDMNMRCEGVWSGIGKLSDIPLYGDPIPFHEVPVPPNGELDAWCFIKIPDRESGALLPGMNLTDEMVDQISGGMLELVAYGYVKYSDHFGIHESRFCFYFAEFFREFRIKLDAPAEYHKCT